MRILPLLLLVPFAAAELPVPAPPGFLDAHVEPEAQGTVRVVLTWEAPAHTGSGPLAGYLVYRNAPGALDLLDPLAMLDAGTESFTDAGLAIDAVYEYHLVAVNEDGHRSPPSNPVTKGPYPSCTWFGWGISPPGVDVRPECLVP